MFHLDRPMYLLGYLAGQSKVYLIDKVRPLVCAGVAAMRWPPRCPEGSCMGRLACDGLELGVDDPHLLVCMGSFEERGSRSRYLKQQRDIRLTFVRHCLSRCRDVLCTLSRGWGWRVACSLMGGPVLHAAPAGVQRGQLHAAAGHDRVQDARPARRPRRRCRHPAADPAGARARAPPPVRALPPPSKHRAKATALFCPMISQHGAHDGCT